MKITDRLEHAWNAFKEGNDNLGLTKDLGSHTSSIGPLHRRVMPYSKSKFAQALFNRIALDVATTNFRYVKIDKKTKDAKILDDRGLQYIVTQEANTDQTHIQFFHDIVFSMFDEGVVAVVPENTSITPTGSGGGIDYETMRTARIVQWRPFHVEVEMYNELNGKYQRIWIAKNQVAILENPLYAVINGPNSTLTRLLSKMNLVDNLDQILASGRLDIIIQLPYLTRHEKKKAAAEERIKSIEEQLGMGNNGIAYTDANENVIQLNRAANSQLLENTKMLKDEFYNQLGLTQSVLDGSASESEMRLYYSRTIDPINKSIIAEFNRKFISKKARTEGHTFEAHRDLFDLVPAQSLATLGDTLRRNSILTSNEVRALLGLESSNDPAADLLVNPNMPAKDQKFGDGGNGSVASPDQDKAKAVNGQNGDNTNEEESNG